jgi:hypothetical protein
VVSVIRTACSVWQHEPKKKGEIRQIATADFNVVAAFFQGDAESMNVSVHVNVSF